MTIKRAKTLGFKGTSQWISPLSGHNLDFIWSPAVADKYRDLKHRISWSERIRVKHKYSHWTESKAFSVSRLMNNDNHLINEAQSPSHAYRGHLRFTSPVCSVPLRFMRYVLNLRGKLECPHLRSGVVSSCVSLFKWGGGDSLYPTQFSGTFLCFAFQRCDFIFTLSLSPLPLLPL